MIIISIIEVIVYIIVVLLSVAYLTVAERKTLGYLQRRLGPNMVGYYGLLQAFADALKLLIKEIIIPKESNKSILILSPLITLLTALIGWIVIPLGPSLVLGDFKFGILFTLAIGSLGVFGTLLSGWSSNSKYSFIGSIRATAQLISYELILTTIYIICLLFVNNLNYTIYIESQRIIWYILPLLPIFIIFYISTIAETNRPPFDLVEAESELVAGFFTEYSGSPFVFFFLAEYSNIILMSALISILFLGGYNSILINFNSIYIFFNNLFQFHNQYTNNTILEIQHLNFNDVLNIMNSNHKNMLKVDQYNYFFLFIEGAYYSFNFIIKIILLLFSFIWIRASLPRFTYDNLINLCWIIFLPILFATILIVPNLLLLFNSIPYNLSTF